jgi:uncharacterized membrane protein YraQ (UPF0718 family)
VSRGVLIVRRSDNEMKRNAEVGRFTKPSKIEKAPVMDFLVDMLRESWHLLLDASVYILFGLLVSGLFRVFLSPDSIGRHLGHGRFSSVFKAALIGVPIPL